MRWTAVVLLVLSTLWFVALTVAAADVLPALLRGQAQGPDDPAFVIVTALAALVMGGCAVVLVGALARSRRAAGGPPPWARRLAFGCAGVLALAALARLGRPEMLLAGFPAVAFAAAALALAPRAPPRTDG